MKLRTLVAAAAALGLSAAATAAGAVTVVLPNVANQLETADNQAILWDFDGLEAANTDFTGNVVGFPASANISNSAPPPWDGGTSVCCQGSNPYLADDTNYASVQGNGTSTFEILNGYYLTSFSFYMGSPDTYNSITFHFIGGASDTLTGDAIWGGAGPSGQAGNGDRTKGFRVYYGFGGDHVNKITFTSSTDAFEFDNLAGALQVPEPSTWALMIGGFGLAGAMLRRRKAALA